MTQLLYQSCGGQRRWRKRRNQKVRDNIKIALLSILVICTGIVAFYRIPEIAKMPSILPQEKIWVQIDTNQAVATSTPIELTKKGVVAARQRDISAYNAGDPSQTDNSPCLGASGVDICNLLDHDICVYAANFVPLGTYLNIEGIGECQVLDRMNKKYPNRVDVAMKLSDKEAAQEFGIQTRAVQILK